MSFVSIIISFAISRHMFLGHDMSVSDFDGRTPLHLAAAEGHLDCVKFLLQSSCEVPVEPTDRYVMSTKRNNYYFTIFKKQIFTL